MRERGESEREIQRREGGRVRKQGRERGKREGWSDRETDGWWRDGDWNWASDRERDTMREGGRNWRQMVEMVGMRN